MLKSIGQKIASNTEERCEDTIYGELLASKLKKLPYHSKIRAKHEIDNIMFKYEILECTDGKLQQNLSFMQPQMQSPTQSVITPRFASPDMQSPVFERHQHPLESNFNLFQPHHST